MDAFKNPIAKIKRRLKLELQVWPIVLYWRGQDKEALAESLKERMKAMLSDEQIAKLKLKVTLNFVERHFPPLLKERKRALWDLYSKSVPEGTVPTVEQMDWLDYIRAHQLAADRKVNASLVMQSQKDRLGADRLVKTSLKNSQELRKVENHFEKLVAARMDKSLNTPLVTPALADPLRVLENDLETREGLATISKEELNAHLGRICQTQDAKSSPISKLELKEMVRALKRLRRYAPNIDTEDKQINQKIDMVLTEWTLRFPKEPYTHLRDKEQAKTRNFLLRVTWDVDLFLREDSLNSKIKNLKILIRGFKTLRDYLDECNPANAIAIEHTDSLFDTWRLHLEELVSLQEELAKLRNESL